MPLQTPWGPLKVADAHVHFFSHGFFASLAAQKGMPVEKLAPVLGWDMPEEDPAALAETWLKELDRHAVDRAVLIASAPGDYSSVIAAVRNHPNRFYGYMVVNPVAADCPDQIRSALASGHMHGICLFPAMHCVSLHDDRVLALLDALSVLAPRVVVFVHCGVLSVGVRWKLGLPSLFDMRFSNPLDLHAIAMRYPQLRFVVPHFGAGYFRESLMLCDLCPNVYLDTSSSNNWVRYQPGLDLKTVFRSALDVAGPQRLLFGTDSSFFPRGWNAAVFDAQVNALQQIGADRETAQLIFHDNLERLLGT
jgi:predicted TIM-barrel fold metal-dependent hydrolase